MSEINLHDYAALRKILTQVFGSLKEDLLTAIEGDLEWTNLNGSDIL